ncbi:MAG: TlpA disulfide reductase family protein [Chthoniobacterales bacterium]
MKNKDKVIPTILALGLLLGSCFLAPASFADETSAQPIANTGTNRVAPGWELKNLEGKPVKLSDFKGKVVVLNFWATWCPPCRREIPDLVALQKQYAGKGLVIVGVAMDEGGPATVKPFVEKMGINYPVVMGDQKTAAAYGGIEVIPTTFIIDKTGRIAAVRQGGADRAAFEEEIKPLL